MTKPKDIKLKLDSNRPEGNLKPLGGSKADEWNKRLNDLTATANRRGNPWRFLPYTQFILLKINLLLDPTI